MHTSETIIEDILRREGSAYTNHPADLGGPTKYGITQATLSSVRGQPCSAEDVRNLQEQEARQIYHKQYVEPFLAYSGEFLALLVDSAVQHGVQRTQDWLHLAHKDETRSLYAALFAIRMKFYGAIITSRPANAVFAKGWMIRLSEFIL